MTKEEIKEKLSETEKLLIKRDTLHFEEDLGWSKMSLREFIQTLHSGNGTLATYYKSGMIQCLGGKSRSFGDSFLLIRHYHKDASIIEMFKIYSDLINEGKLFTSFCNLIGKRVFKSTDTMLYNNYLKNKEDEFGFTYMDYIKFSKPNVKTKES